MIEIVGYDDQYAEDFRRLNEAWLVRFFRIEPIDAAILAAPREKIVEPGGQVFFAVEAGDVLGTCALKRSGDADFELTKMAVTESAQGRGIGRLLMQSACDWFGVQGGRMLFLESHSTLKAALGLYRVFGFVDKPRPFSSDYERSDVYMEWQGPNSVGKP